MPEDQTSADELTPSPALFPSPEETEAALKKRKGAIRRRLTSEGRWPAANEFFETVRKGCLDMGLSREEAVNTAWDEIDRNFPPRPKRKIFNKKAGKRATKEQEPAATETAATETLEGPENKEGKEVTDTSEQAPVPRPHRIDAPWVPRAWGNLPASVKFEDEVDWVYGNYHLIVQERPGGKTKLRMSRALKPAPSVAAVGLAYWAKDHRKAFYEKMVPMAKKGFDGGEEELVRRDRKSIAEIRAILEQMREIK